MNAPIFKEHYKVYINHTDAGGIVYHANHLTFFENCRRDWLSSLGFDGYFFDQHSVDVSTNAVNKVHFVVSHADVSYRSAIFIDDMLVVSVQEVIKKPASLILTQHIYRSDEHYQQGKIAATGIITLACVMNKDGKIHPCRLPSALSIPT
ncbi:acyl-CoA thioesterase [Moraxella sp. Tifton1]|uniref:Thioesterase family protein n=1 Tax=Moraxella oculi TaxID=2940516 RepID=A0ABW8U3L1_9GAMM|nr:thioesterase family protein [Moraxella sp. Tifton1]MCL1622846.1 acyl-CoA thioesterase [Moraxella sp. Tifton1]